MGEGRAPVPLSLSTSQIVWSQGGISNPNSLLLFEQDNRPDSILGFHVNYSTSDSYL